MLLGLLLAISAHAGCDAVLVVALNQGERGFDAGDMAAVDAALKEATRAVSCAYQPLTPTESARMHRLVALSAHLHGNSSRAETALRAMVRADPWLGMLEMVPPEHPLALLAVAVEERAPSAAAPLLLPEDGDLRVDGLRALLAPTEHPYVYQQQLESGEVVASAWIDAGGSAPRLVGSAGRRRRAGTGLKVAGLVIGAAGGAAYGVAFAERARYEDAVKAKDNPAIQQRYDRTNALTLGAVAGATAGATMLTVGFAI